MADGVRVSFQTLKLLRVFLDDPSAQRYGLQLASEADLKTGTIYPALARLEQAGWLESHWESVNPARQGRPRRRLYRLTALGEQTAAALLDAVAVSPRPGRRGFPQVERPGLA
jgi:PadR family transcriptional regulator, regulatory protein PadR